MAANLPSCKFPSVADCPQKRGRFGERGNSDYCIHRDGPPLTPCLTAELVTPSLEGHSSSDLRVPEDPCYEVLLVDLGGQEVSNLAGNHQL